MNKLNNISDIIENIKDRLFKDYYYATLETKIEFQEFIRSQIEQLFVSIEDDDSLIDESNGRYNREIELRYQIKNLMK